MKNREKLLRNHKQLNKRFCYYDMAKRMPKVEEKIIIEDAILKAENKRNK